RASLRSLLHHRGSHSPCISRKAKSIGPVPWLRQRCHGTLAFPVLTHDPLLPAAVHGSAFGECARARGASAWRWPNYAACAEPPEGTEASAPSRPWPRRKRAALKGFLQRNPEQPPDRVGC